MFTACFVTRLLQEAGVPPGVLQFVPGRGETVGNALVGDLRIAGVAFTGSTETARLIARTGRAAAWVNVSGRALPAFVVRA